MARAVRVEFPGAFYHVMARGDRGEAIVRDDADRATFVRTLAEASERSVFRVHAFALMSNHYHLLLETPRANLSRGMGWLQNAFTRRINTRHGLWGHLFGGRDKAILVEPGNCSGRCWTTSTSIRCEQELLRRRTGSTSLAALSMRP